ncbi:sensor histidine kinase [Salinibius halmophilus]|uniref:sensor histidine kinase n=1 Tax=Salinibius halmophilus TaxID=1853216 RepID=UPI000E6692EA|nr:ATP-binding protein [Salinibius halmophilus]
MVNYSLLQQVHRHGKVAPPPLTQFDLATVIDALPVAVLLIGNNGLISHANPAADNLLAHDALPSLAGSAWRNVVQSCFRPSAADEHELTLHNGRIVSLSTSAMPNKGQIIVLNDQTETRQLQQRMAHQQRLTSMGQMVASLAHQIRTPLSTATLYCSNLLEKDLNRDKQVKFLSKIRDRLQFLERHIRDMLVFARGEIPLEDNCLISELLVDVSELAKEKGIEVVVSCHGDGLLRCNKDVLLGGLLNLVSNASEAGASEIRVTANIAEHANIAVIDNGKGMSSELVARLDQAFVTTKSTGTGLGIAVVRAIAKAHLGQFFIESIESQGSTMTLQLPVRNQECL